MMPYLAFTHANVFDGKMESELQKDMTILVAITQTGKTLNGIITAIEPSNTLSIPGDSREIDITGKYVIPGMINAHAHLFGTGKPMKLMGASEQTMALIAKLLKTRLGKTFYMSAMRKNVKTALNSGVTTIRTAGDFNNYDIALRKQIETGKIQGPRLVTAGRSICVTGGHGAYMSHVIDNPWDGRKAVRDCLRHESDVVKILSTGGVTDARRLGEAGRPQMTVEEISAICDEAHRAGFKVMTHCESTQGIRDALEGGVDSIEHGAPIPDDLISKFIHNPNALHGYTTLVSTISAPVDLCELGIDVLKIPEVVRQNGEIIRDGMIAGLKTAVENGIPLGMGTDASVPFVAHYEFWRELIYYQHFAGVSNKQAINIATQQNAKLLGIDAITGTLEESKCADFIVLDGNPLDNLLVLENVRHVVYRGNLIPTPSYKKVKILEKYAPDRFFEKARKAYQPL